MSVEEYTQWVDKIMSFNTVDAARTTSLPLSDEGPVLASWDDILNKPIKGRHKSTKSKGDLFDEMAEACQEDAVELPKGAKVRVYWTELKRWYKATVTSSKMVADENGQRYRATHVTYDAADGWRKKADLSYTHCLEDIDWAMVD